VSKHRLDARLVPLERSVRAATAQRPDCAPDFTIDPTLAKSLRDDCHRLGELEHKASASKHGDPMGAAELKEKESLRASIADRARKIGCPVGYTELHARNDSNRLHQLGCQRMSPRGTLTNAEDAEEAQVRARLCAFGESPEGRARSRIFDLVVKGWHRKGRSPAEQDELDSLRAIYPDPPLDDDPLKEFIEHSRAITTRLRSEFIERSRARHSRADAGPPNGRRPNHGQ
jgi:hypothetical protein